MLNKRIRVDLHIHSSESWHKESPGLVDESDVDHLDTLLDKLSHYGVNLISITDHNYLNASLYRELERVVHSDRCPCLEGVIAGVEFDVKMEEGEDKEPCHIMAYFDVRHSEQFDMIAETLEGSSKRSQEFKYSREGFEQVIYKIGLPTILLAYQRRDVENKSGGRDNSFSLGVEDYITYLRIGYISGFDLQKPLVEGMVLSRLAEVESVGNIASILASDCHQWSAYPLHDASKHEAGGHQFTEYNALPTFRGLQMAMSSPMTRFNRGDAAGCRAIESLSIGGQKVPLSPGLNAIIGDNGAGKSTLLHILANEALEQHQREIKQLNSIRVTSPSHKVRFVRQAELANNYAKNTDLERAFDLDYYPVVDSSAFVSCIDGFVSQLSRRMRKEIEAYEEPVERALTIEVTRRTHYVTILHGQSEAIDESELFGRVNGLRAIIHDIDSELGADSYSEAQRARLQLAWDNVVSVLNEKRAEYDGVRATNRAMGVVTDCVRRYEEATQKKRNSQDADARNHAERMSETVKSICARAQSVCIKELPYPVFPHLEEIRSLGRASNVNAGYRFLTYLRYYGMTDEQVRDALFSALFNKPFSTPNGLRRVHTDADWVDCVRGTTKRGEVDAKLKENLNRFLGEMTAPFHEIQLLSRDDESIGSTLGERALVFYAVIADQAARDDCVLFIDQPEDNVSNYRIITDLSASINSLRNSHQVVFVTHNPLLVVNLDVDNVIYVEGERELGYKSGGNRIRLTAGCLEDEESDILGIIARQMDGGRDAIQRRLNVYGDPKL